MIRFDAQIYDKLLLPWLLGRIWRMLGLLICVGFITATPAMAAPAGNPVGQPATEVTVSLGNSANELKFVPERLEFIAGKRYKLLLTNPSPQKHYFTAKDFADNIWTQKVEAGKGNAFPSLMLRIQRGLSTALSTNDGFLCRFLMLASEPSGQVTKRVYSPLWPPKYIGLPTASNISQSPIFEVFAPTS